jgi:hypothetical protein
MCESRYVIGKSSIPGRPATGKPDDADGNDVRRLGDCVEGLRRGPVALRPTGAERPQIPGGAAFFRGPQFDLARVASRIRSMEHHLEALLAAQPVGRDGGVPSSPRPARRHIWCRCSTAPWFGARLRGWCERRPGKSGPWTLTRSRGGLSRMWGDVRGTDMTGRSVAGWGFVDGMGFAVGRNRD